MTREGAFPLKGERLLLCDCELVFLTLSRGVDKPSRSFVIGSLANQHSSRSRARFRIKHLVVLLKLYIRFDLVVLGLAQCLH